MILPFLVTALALHSACGLALTSRAGRDRIPATVGTSRANFFRSVAIASVGASVGTAAASPATGATAGLKPKLTNLTDEELKRIITADMVERSFLVSADLTREIYDESSVFIDEIDSYPIDKWVKGTQRLFVAEGSRVSLVGDIDVSPEKVEFRFDEDLMFRIPFRPVVSLSGRVELSRDADSGLITGYREFWDQDVNSVLKTAKFKASDGTMKPFPVLGGSLF